MKKSTLILALLLLVGATISAQTKHEWKLWEGNPPTPNGTTGEEVYHNAHYTNVQNPTLTVYPAPNPSGVAVLACPGGGYVDVWTGTEGHPMAWWYLNQGITYAVLKYRLPNGHPTVPLEDVHRAMDLLWEHAEELGIKHLGVQGCSAGGHLAATAATMYDTPKHRPDFQILFYPFISLNPDYTNVPCKEQLIGKGASNELSDRYSLEKQVTNDTPPAIILMSTDDHLISVRHAMDYYMALKEKNVSATLHMYPTGRHGWCYQEWFMFKHQWQAEVERWLEWLKMTAWKD